jgi:hypothetical protein
LREKPQRWRHRSRATLTMASEALKMGIIRHSWILMWVWRMSICITTRWRTKCLKRYASAYWLCWSLG